MELSDQMMSKMQNGGSFIVNNPAELDKSKKRSVNSSFSGGNSIINSNSGGLDTGVGQSVNGVV